MKFAGIIGIAIIVLLASPLALPQNPTQPGAPAPAATSPSPAKAAPAAAEQAVDTLPRKYIDLWNTGNFEGFQGYFLPNASIVSHGNRSLLKPEVLRRVITVWRKSLPDLNLKIDDTIVQGDKVAMRLTLTGTYKDRLFPNTAVPSADSPRIVHITEMLMFQIRDGKIQQIWEEYDEARLRIEMGGSWRTDKELSAIASPKPAPAGTPSGTTPQKP